MRKRVVVIIFTFMISCTGLLEAHAACCEQDFGGCAGLGAIITSTSFDRVARTCTATSAASAQCVNQIHGNDTACNVAGDCGSYTITVDLTCYSFYQMVGSTAGHEHCQVTNGGVLCSSPAIACNHFSNDPLACQTNFWSSQAGQDARDLCDNECLGLFRWCPGFTYGGPGVPLFCSNVINQTSDCGAVAIGNCEPDPMNPTQGRRRHSNNCCEWYEDCCVPQSGQACDNGVLCTGTYDCVGNCSAPNSPLVVTPCAGNGVNCPGVLDCDGNCAAPAMPVVPVPCPGNGPFCTGVQDCNGACAAPATPTPPLPCAGNGINCPGTLDCAGICQAPLTPTPPLPCSNGVNCPGTFDCTGNCSAPLTPTPALPCFPNGPLCPGTQDCNATCIGAPAMPVPALPCFPNGPLCPGTQNCSGVCLGAPATPTPPISCGTARCPGNMDCMSVCSAPAVPPVPEACQLGTGCMATPGCTTTGFYRCDDSCDAPLPLTPVAESCNGQDDDCDCLVDEDGVCVCDWGFYDDGNRHRQRASDYLDTQVR